VRYYFVVIALIILLGPARPQAVSIQKSDRIESIDGKSFYVHQVEKGQTLYSISKAYQISQAEIKQINPGAESELRIGQNLFIPSGEQKQESFKPLNEGKFDFFYHVSKKGESFKDIAYIYMVKESFVKRANTDLSEPLQEGIYVKIPVNMDSKPIASKPEPITRKTTPVRFDTKPHQANTVPEQKPEPPKANQGFIKHIVKKGETLYRLSKNYNVGQDEIKAANPGLTPNLALGQLVKIPKTPVAQQTQQFPEEGATSNDLPEGYKEHEILKGETIYSIARMYKVSLETLKEINPGLSSRIKPGQIIFVPTVLSNKKSIDHKVENRKEKLHKIAKKYGLQLSDLMELNPNAPRKVYRDQIIKIPVEYEEQVASKDTTDLEIIRIEDSPDFDSIMCYKNQEINRQTTYKVALMLPFYLREADSLLIEDLIEDGKVNMPRKFRFLEFYEGMQLALDTLQKQGLNLELFVYDVNSDMDELDEIMTQPLLQQMDLIIGPLFSTPFIKVANFAQMHNIKIVNPFTAKDELFVNKPTSFKIQPNEKSKIGQLVEFVSNKYPDSKIILIRNNEYQFTDLIQSYATAFQDSIKTGYQVPNYLLHNILVAKSENEVDNFRDSDDLLASLNIEGNLIVKEDFNLFLDDTVTIPNRVTQLIYNQDSIRGISEAASVVRQNVIIALMEDKSQILDMITHLNVVRDTFEIHLFGLPDWNKHAEFEPELYLNLDLHVFTPHFIDYSDNLTDWFIQKYRDRFIAEPEDFAFQGFDISYYFLSALMNFGRGFENCLQFHSPRLIQSAFHFLKPEHDGFQNAYWNIYRFEDYQMIKQSNFYFLNQKNNPNKQQNVLGSFN
jgi:LysM repeat protein